MAVALRKPILSPVLTKCKNLLPIQGIYSLGHSRFSGSNASTTKETVRDELAEEESLFGEKVNKVVKEYMVRKEKYVAFMNQEMEEYEKGKQFLAKIMGKEVKDMTTDEINESIKYLFPSGLFEPKARPVFANPEELYKKEKDIQFDKAGRPFHFLFYTSKPNFSEILHNCAGQLENIRKKLRANPENLKIPHETINLKGTQWISKGRLEAKTMENIKDSEYNKFIESMNLLVNHPCSYEARTFIMNYREPLSSAISILPFQTSTETLEDGRHFVTVRSRKKTCRGSVTVISPGTGKIEINGEGIDFFDLPERQNVCTIFSS